MLSKLSNLPGNAWYLRYSELLQEVFFRVADLEMASLV